MAARDPSTSFDAKLFVHLLDFLGSADLGHCLNVNKTWKQVAAADILWKKACKRDWLLEDSSFLSTPAYDTWVASLAFVGRLCDSATYRSVMSWWRRIEGWSKRDFPPISNSLRGGASDGEIDQVLQELELPMLPAALRLLYKIHDGQCLQFDDALERQEPQAVHPSAFHGLFGGVSFYDHYVSVRLLSLRRVVRWTLRLRQRPSFRRDHHSKLLFAASFNFRRLFFVDCVTGMVHVGSGALTHLLPCVPAGASPPPFAAGALLQGGSGAAHPPMCATSTSDVATAAAAAAGGGDVQPPPPPSTAPPPLPSQQPAPASSTDQQVEAVAQAAAACGDGEAKQHSQDEPSCTAPAAAAAPQQPSDAPLLCWLWEYLRRLETGELRIGRVDPELPISEGIVLFPTEASPACTRAVTRGVVCTASAHFVPEASDPSQDSYLWAYSIRLHLSDDGGDGFQECQLHTRHWEVTDGVGETEVVDGEGVIGRYPVLRPGEPPFVYQSCSHMHPTPGTFGGHLGFVVGTLQDAHEDTDTFDVRVEPVTFALPTFIF